jgi:hypothetical protein
MLPRVQSPCPARPDRSSPGAAGPRVCLAGKPPIDFRTLESGRLAQLVERCFHTAEVTGSSPVPPTINQQLSGQPSAPYGKNTENEWPESRWGFDLFERGLIDASEKPLLRRSLAALARRIEHRDVRSPSLIGSHPPLRTLPKLRRRRSGSSQRIASSFESGSCPESKEDQAALPDEGAIARQDRDAAGGARPALRRGAARIAAIVSSDAGSSGSFFGSERAL